MNIFAEQCASSVQRQPDVGGLSWPISSDGPISEDASVEAAEVSRVDDPAHAVQPHVPLSPDGQRLEGSFCAQGHATAPGAGKILGSGSLGSPKPEGTGTCSFPFSISGVSTEEQQYAVEIGDRGRVVKSKAEMEAGGWKVGLSLGSGD